MKHFLFYDLPLEKQAALSVITLYDVVTEKGILRNIRVLYLI